MYRTGLLVLWEILEGFDGLTKELERMRLVVVYHDDEKGNDSYLIWRTRGI